MSSPPAPPSAIDVVVVEATLLFFFVALFCFVVAKGVVFLFFHSLKWGHILEPELKWSVPPHKQHRFLGGLIS